MDPSRIKSTPVFLPLCGALGRSPRTWIRTAFRFGFPCAAPPFGPAGAQSRGSAQPSHTQSRRIDGTTRGRPQITLCYSMLRLMDRNHARTEECGAADDRDPAGMGSEVCGGAGPAPRTRSRLAAQLACRRKKAGISNSSSSCDAPVKRSAGSSPESRGWLAAFAAAGAGAAFGSLRGATRCVG